MPDHESTPAICPVCGAEVPERARACPDCGADHQTGWNEETTAGDGLDLPDNDFDYDAYVKREFGKTNKPPPTKKIWVVALTVAVVFIGLLWLWRWLQETL